MYTAVGTRPDIAYAVGMVSRYCKEPNATHLTAVKRIFRYLRGTSDLCLKYEKGNDEVVVGYSDADWAGDLNDRPSTTGNVFMQSGAAISWLSKKQATVALSTSEAEYIALSLAAQEITWLRKLLSEFGVKFDGPTTLMEDNQGAIAIANNPVNHARTKHIDIRYHYIRQCILEGIVKVHYCSTENMYADMFTKPLPKGKFEMLRIGIGLRQFRDI